MTGSIPPADRGPAPDLPGFGRSGKPGSRRYTIDEYEDFLERFLEELDVERVSLVMHDWGVVAWPSPSATPRRVERLVADQRRAVHTRL